MPKQHGKRYTQAAAALDRTRSYSVEEALTFLKGVQTSKMDETVELALRLGVDPKKTDQRVRGSFSLPHGIGKEKRVVVFAEGDAAEEARAAGALEVGSAELAARIQGGWLDFDVAIAHPDTMRHVGKLGKILGPQGKMPTPKGGTVTTAVGQAVREFRAGKVEFRADEVGNLHVPVGKKSFEVAALAANIRAFVDHVKTLRPAAAKGVWVQKLSLSSTMGPGVPVVE